MAGFITCGFVTRNLSMSGGVGTITFAEAPNLDKYGFIAKITCIKLYYPRLLFQRRVNFLLQIS